MAASFQKNLYEVYFAQSSGSATGISQALTDIPANAGDVIVCVLVKDDDTAFTTIPTGFSTLLTTADSTNAIRVQVDAKELTASDINSGAIVPYDWDSGSGSTDVKRSENQRTSTVVSSPIRGIAFTNDGYDLHLLGNVSSVYSVVTIALDVPYSLSGADLEQTEHLERLAVTEAYDLVISPDGNYLYTIVNSGGTPKIERWPLDEPNRPVTADLASKTSFSLNSSYTYYALAWSADGYTLYLGSSNSSVFQYSVTTAYSFTGITLDGEVSPTELTLTYASGIIFNPTGTEVLITNASSTTATSSVGHYYTVSTAWDLTSTLTLIKSLTGDFPVWGNKSYDGLSVYGMYSNTSARCSTVVNAWQGGTLSWTADSEQYTLRTHILRGVDLTSYTTSLSASGTDDWNTAGTIAVIPPVNATTSTSLNHFVLSGIGIDGDSTPIVQNGAVATPLYAITETGAGGCGNYQFISTYPLADDTVPHGGASVSRQFYAEDYALGYLQNVTGMSYSPNGEHLIFVESSTDRIYQAELAAEFNGLSHDTSDTVLCKDFAVNVLDTCWADDGWSIFFLIDTPEIQEFDVNTRWDASTMDATPIKTQTFTESNYIWTLQFNDTGTRFYINTTTDSYGSNSGTLKSWTLSTAWDITTLSASTTFAFTGSNHRAAILNSDGTRLIRSLYSGTPDHTESIEIYELSTAWDISTLSKVSTRTDVANQNFRDYYLLPNPSFTNLLGSDGGDTFGEISLGEGKGREENYIIFASQDDSIGWTVAIEVPVTVSYVVADPMTVTVDVSTSIEGTVGAAIHEAEVNAVVDVTCVPTTPFVAVATWVVDGTRYYQDTGSYSTADRITSPIEIDGHGLLRIVFQLHETSGVIDSETYFKLTCKDTTGVEVDLGLSTDYTTPASAGVSAFLANGDTITSPLIPGGTGTWQDGDFSTTPTSSGIVTASVDAYTEVAFCVRLNPTTDGDDTGVIFYLYDAADTLLSTVNNIFRRRNYEAVRTIAWQGIFDDNSESTATLWETPEEPLLVVDGDPFKIRYGIANYSDASKSFTFRLDYKLEADPTPLSISTTLREATITTSASVLGEDTEYNVYISNDGSLLLVGYSHATVSGLTQAGIVIVYEWNGSNYVHRDAITATTPAQDGFFGRYVACNEAITRIAVASGGTVVETFEYSGGSWSNTLADITASRPHGMSEDGSLLFAYGTTSGDATVYTYGASNWTARDTFTNTGEGVGTRGYNAFFNTTNDILYFNDGDGYLRTYKYIASAWVEQSSSVRSLFGATSALHGVVDDELFTFNLGTIYLGSHYERDPLYIQDVAHWYSPDGSFAVELDFPTLSVYSNCSYSDDWLSVGAQGTAVEDFVFSASANITDGEATSRRLLPENTFNAGQVRETNTDVSVTIGAGEVAEIEFVLESVPANVSIGEIYDFYLYETTMGHHIGGLVDGSLLPVKATVQNAQKMKHLYSRWRNDDNTEALATWKELAEVDTTVVEDDLVRLRAVTEFGLIGNAPGVVDYNLYYKELDSPTEYWEMDQYLSGNISLSKDASVMAIIPSPVTGLVHIYDRDDDATEYVYRTGGDVPTVSGYFLYFVGIDGSGTRIVTARYSNPFTRLYTYDWSGSAWVLVDTYSITGFYARVPSLSDDGQILIYNVGAAVYRFTWNSGTGSWNTPTSSVLTGLVNGSTFEHYLALTGDGSVLFEVQSYYSTGKGIAIYDWNGSNYIHRENIFETIVRTNISCTHDGSLITPDDAMYYMYNEYDEVWESTAAGDRPITHSISCLSGDGDWFASGHYQSDGDTTFTVSKIKKPFFKAIEEQADGDLGHWMYANSTHITDGEATTQQLTTGPFSAGEVSESSPSSTASITTVSKVENEFVLEPTARARDNHTYQFKLGYNASPYALLASYSTLKAVYDRLPRTFTGEVVVSSDIDQTADGTVILPASVVINQLGYRGRVDTGYETDSPTWIADLNETWYQAFDTLFRVRFSVEITTAPAPARYHSYKVQYNYNNAGTYTYATGTYLEDSGGIAADHFGSQQAVSGDGKVLVIVAEGASEVHTYDNSASGWVFRNTLSVAATDAALSYNGGIMIIGDAAYNSGQGRAQVYTHSTTWTQQGSDLTASDGGAGDSYGRGVGISGDGTKAAVGAPNWDYDGSNLNSGKVYTYTRVNTTVAFTEWDLITNTTGAEEMGFDVDISSNGLALILGTPGYAGVATDNGAVFFADHNGSAWVIRSSALAGTNSGARYGEAVSFNYSGRTIFVGSPYYDDVGTNEGVVHVIDWNGVVGGGADYSTRQSLSAPDTSNNQYFGSSVAISSDNTEVTIGGMGINTDKGRVYPTTLTETWLDVEDQGGSSLPLRYANSTWITDQEASSQYITSGTYLAGQVAEGPEAGHQTTTTDYSEVEYVLTVDSAIADIGDSFKLRILDNEASGYINIYNTYPRFIASIIPPHQGEVDATVDVIVHPGQTYLGEVTSTVTTDSTIDGTVVGEFDKFGEVDITVDVTCGPNEGSVIRAGIVDAIAETWAIPEGRVALRGLVENLTFGVQQQAAGTMILAGEVQSTVTVSTLLDAIHYLNGEVDSSIDVSLLADAIQELSGRSALQVIVNADIQGHIEHWASLYTHATIDTNINGHLTNAAKCVIIGDVNTNIIAHNYKIVNSDHIVNTYTSIDGSITRGAAASISPTATVLCVATLESGGELKNTIHTYAHIEGTVLKPCVKNASNIEALSDRALINQETNTTNIICGQEN